MLIPVILSGGAGTRLWPVSRQAHPKPFITLADGLSLLQGTLQRAGRLPGVEQVVTVTNRDHYFKTQAEFAAIDDAKGLRFEFLLEPVGRNTAPAAAVAALYVAQTHGPDALMLVLPADHLVERHDAFAIAVSSAKRLAEKGYLVTFGIRPNYPETGFGYIEVGAALPGAHGQRAERAADVTTHKVASFVEKPNETTARTYLESGRHLWNSGMFCFQAGVFLDALMKLAPRVYEGAVTCWEASARNTSPIELADAFAELPNVSVDYAVMEKAEGVTVVGCDIGWSDVGSWKALSSFVPADKAGNRLVGQVVSIDSRNCFIQSENRVVGAVGVKDLVIVDTPDALLVGHKDQIQDVKQVVEQLKAAAHESYRDHRTVHRPWGTYTVLAEDERFKTKRIVVKPGGSLSLQLHHHRSEHWVVIAGTATVVNGAEELLLQRGESTFIPVETPHRLTNRGTVDLEIIEVQTGDYLGEDDIQRLEDQYGRA
ncbi:MAG: mannose-1-phosphate guanylyltransferase/mannose-6-phosphate isomerase [Gammaproteobacteria bacterium]|nr:mannose-1-phosphate guanylyltransferase/mannose-6-phosphate isomerase [Gammaproteobacteria bacterium]